MARLGNLRAFSGWTVSRRRRFLSRPSWLSYTPPDACAIASAMVKHQRAEATRKGDAKAV